MSDWKIYRGDGAENAERWTGPLPKPPWRDFDRLDTHRARSYQPPESAVEVVNAALYLRRPLLVTGDPGTGKSSLIYNVARELGLGQVLTWPINSRSTLAGGLYQYDAVGRLRQAQIDREGGDKGKGAAARETAIGDYIRLGPLGNAFLPTDKPRALLIDEIDKSDVDLPNDLLHVLENGRFSIPELVRLASRGGQVGSGAPADTAYQVGSSDRDGNDVKVEITGGRVQCSEFPFIVITSNGERDLPPAFLRRCLRLDMKTPQGDDLRKIIETHLGEDDTGTLTALLKEFEDKRTQGSMLATDQLLNAVFLVTRGQGMSKKERETLEAALLRELEPR